MISHLSRSSDPMTSISKDERRGKERGRKGRTRTRTRVRTRARARARTSDVNKTQEVNLYHDDGGGGWNLIDFSSFDI